MRKANRQAARGRGARLRTPALWVLLGLLWAAPVFGQEEADLRLPPLTGDELPSFASVAQPPELAGDAPPDDGTQPRDASAAIPDDPASRRLTVPGALLGQDLPGAPEEAPRLGPDEFEVFGSFDYTKGVIRVRGGGVRLSINSLVAGARISIFADSAIYNEKTGEAELSGGVRLEVPEAGLRLDASYFNYDPLMQRMRIEGAQLELPLDILPAGTFGARPIRPSFTGHFYTPDPEFVRVRTELATIDYNPRRRAFDLSEVKLSASSHPDPDFYVKARRLSIGQDNRLQLKGISVHMSGLKLLEWPSYQRGAQKESRPVSFGFPSVSANRDGLSWKQPVELNFGNYQMDGLADYSDEYGLLLSTRIAQQVAPGTLIGVRSGTRNVSDIDRQRVERNDGLLTELSYEAKQPVDGVQRLRLDAEYGEVTETIPRREGEPAITQTQATRLLLGGSVEFDPIPLGNDVYLTAGAHAQHIDYGGLSDNYTVAGGELGLVLPQPRDDFNNYVVYRYRSVAGTPRMSFDEVRKEELDFAAQFRFEPKWRQTLHGIYDLDLSRFDTLQLGAMRRQRSYEVGMYYDFARDSAGLELGLLVD